MQSAAGVVKFLRIEERFRKASFPDKLVWMEGLTVEVKLHFLTDKCGWKASVTVEVKLCFLTD